MNLMEMKISQQMSHLISSDHIVNPVTKNMKENLKTTIYILMMTFKREHIIKKRFLTTSTSSSSQDPALEIAYVIYPVWFWLFCS